MTFCMYYATGPTIYSLVEASYNHFDPTGHFILVFEVASFSFPIVGWISLLLVRWAFYGRFSSQGMSPIFRIFEIMRMTLTLDRDVDE